MSDPSELEIIAHQHEEDGDDVQAIHLMDRALKLRMHSRQSPAEIAASAERLVVKCNTVAVRCTKKDDFDNAVAYLSLAAQLTEAPSDLRGAASPFFGAESQRVKLRSTTMNNLGCLERRRGQPEAAVRFLEAALQLDGGTSASTLTNLGALNVQLGRMAQAVGCCRRAIHIIESSPSSDVGGLRAVTWHNLATALESVSPMEAAQAYETALQCAIAEFGPSSAMTESIRRNFLRFQAAAPHMARMAALPSPSAGVSGNSRTSFLPPISSSASAPMNRQAPAPQLPSSVQHSWKQTSQGGHVGGTTTKHASTSHAFGVVNTEPTTPGRHKSKKSSHESSTVPRPVTSDDAAPRTARLASHTEPRPPPPKTARSSSKPPAPKSAFESTPPPPALGSSTNTARRPPPRKSEASVDMGMSSRKTTSLDASSLQPSPSKALKTSASNLSGSRAPGGGGPSGSRRDESGAGGMPSVSSGHLDEDEKRKEDVVAFLVARLGALLTVEDTYEQRYQAAVKIQNMARSRAARAAFEKRLFHRTKMSELALLRERHAAKNIIQFFKMLVERRREMERQRENERKEERVRDVAAVKIQSAARRWLAKQMTKRLRKYNRRFNRALRALQCWFRQNLAKRLVSKLRATRRLAVQGKLVFEKRNRAAKDIQRLFRSHRDFGKLSELRKERRIAVDRERDNIRVSSAKRIQRCWRQRCARLACQARRVILRAASERARRAELRKHATIVLQSWARGLAVRTRIPQITEPRRRARQAKWEAKRLHAAKRIQCAIRCALARRLVARARGQRNGRVLASKTVFYKKELLRCVRGFRARLTLSQQYQLALAAERAFEAQLRKLQQIAERSRVVDSQVVVATTIVAAVDAAPKTDDAPGAQPAASLQERSPPKPESVVARDEPSTVAVVNPAPIYDISDALDIVLPEASAHDEVPPQATASTAITEVAPAPSRAPTAPSTSYVETAQAPDEKDTTLVSEEDARQSDDDAQLEPPYTVPPRAPTPTRLKISTRHLEESRKAELKRRQEQRAADLEREVQTNAQIIASAKAGYVPAPPAASSTGPRRGSRPSMHSRTVPTPAQREAERKSTAAFRLQRFFRMCFDRSLYRKRRAVLQEYLDQVTAFHARSPTKVRPEGLTYRVLATQTATLTPAAATAGQLGPKARVVQAAMRWLNALIHVKDAAHRRVARERASRVLAGFRLVVCARRELRLRRAASADYINDCVLRDTAATPPMIVEQDATTLSVPASSSLNDASATPNVVDDAQSSQPPTAGGVDVQTASATPQKHTAAPSDTDDSQKAPATFEPTLTATPQATAVPDVSSPHLGAASFEGSIPAIHGASTSIAPPEAQVVVASTPPAAAAATPAGSAAAAPDATPPPGELQRPDAPSPFGESAKRPMREPGESSPASPSAETARESPQALPTESTNEASAHTKRTHADEALVQGENGTVAAAPAALSTVDVDPIPSLASPQPAASPVVTSVSAPGGHFAPAMFDRESAASRITRFVRFAAAKNNLRKRQRRVQQSRVDREAEEEKVFAAMRIQCAQRQRVARARLDAKREARASRWDEIERQSSAALKIQSSYRSHRAREQTKQRREEHQRRWEEYREAAAHEIEEDYSVFQ